MSVTSCETDISTGTLTLVADFAATPEQVWELLADPRKLERWWGPPEYPATFVTHEFTAGGEVVYYMTSPEGAKFFGYWQITSVNPPKLLEFTDGFANDDGSPNPSMPVTSASIEIFEHNGGTRMQLQSTADSSADMKKLIEMGVVEGLTAAVGQMDALLAV
jgi:uncharacterized protein YndB with AHSA1/START domain